MEWATIEASWREYQLNARTRWTRLSREELERIAGKRDLLIDALRAAYHYDEQEAAEQLAAWQGALRHADPFK